MVLSTVAEAPCRDQLTELLSRSLALTMDQSLSSLLLHDNFKPVMAVRQILPSGML